MNQKDSFSKRAGDFFAGKGFYIVLILCVAVIGASAWAILAHSNDSSDDGLGMTLSAPETTPDGTTSTGEQRDQATMAEQNDPFAVEDELTGLEQDLYGDEETGWFDSDDDQQDTEPEVPETPEEPEPGEQTESEGAVEPAEVTSFVWPVRGEIEVPHSVEELIYDRTMGDWRTHSGIDITADVGEKIMAIAPGTVEQVYSDDLYGTTVVIDHGNGLRSVYSNLAATPTVVEGDQVASGAYIGAVGETALVETGIVSHLHLEMIQDGVRVDPMDYMPEQQ